jgi:predicted TIM-barrel fold metal-dependent hydrolase
MFLLAACGAAAAAQSLTIEEYEPKSTLVVPQHAVTRAKFPFVDVHRHVPRPSPEITDRLIREMDAINMRVLVNLSGGTGEALKNGIAVMKGRYPDRFVTFANFSFQGIDEPDYADRLAAQFEQDLKNGAQGLKIFKNFGMDLVDGKKQRIHVDDPRFDKAFEVCAKYKVPVLIHTAEPKPFFDPVDKHNERWLELKQFPQRARPPERYPSWDVLMNELYARVARHPRVNFINAHLGWLGGDLAALGRLFEKHPNMYTEIGAVLAEIGRQPRAFRDFMARWGDRVLMGKDAVEDLSEYHVYFRVLETEDEYFDYYRKRHAFWKMYGAGLPDDALRKLYYRNAAKLIPGLSGLPR